MPFELTSPAFHAGAAIPRKFTCDGQDVSPPLAWSGAPDGTAALALVVDDPDARGFVHWVALDLDGATSGKLAEGASTASGAPHQGRNDFRRTGWGGPCPPSGTHRYRFTLYALDAATGLDGHPTSDELKAAIKGHVLNTTELLAKYTRGG
jgi:Raf kinase inhibitor-like YbhB/YbcL family protein